MSLELTDGQFFKKLKWYPPGETKIPLTAIFFSFFSSKDNFERILCDYLKVNQCLLANSGRALLSSLLTILKHRDKNERNEVLIPGYTCYSVAASVARAGLKIKTYDLDPLSLELDLDSVTKAAGGKTLAIITQHLFGIPAPVNRIQKIGRDVGAYLIEDAAQALGGALNGRLLGTIGDFGFYSFGRGKPLPLGCGGALIGKDADILSRLDLKPTNKGYASLISTSISQVMSKPSLYCIPEMLPLDLGETIFAPDFNISTMPAVMKRLAKRALHTLEDLNTRRCHIASLYKEAFANAALIPVPVGARAVYTRFPLMTNPGPIPHELKRFGVRRMYPKAIADEGTIGPYLSTKQSPTFGASEIAQSLITLPTHMGITENLAKEIAQKVKTTYM